MYNAQKKLRFAIQCCSAHFWWELDELIDAELLDWGVSAVIRRKKKRSKTCKCQITPSRGQSLWTTLPTRFYFPSSQFLSFTTNVKCAGTVSSEFPRNFHAKTRLDNTARRQSTSLPLISLHGLNHPNLKGGASYKSQFWLKRVQYNRWKMADRNLWRCSGQYINSPSMTVSWDCEHV